MSENIDDLRLPPGVIAKILKDALPDGAMVSKVGRCVLIFTRTVQDARIAIARAAAVFILNMTTYANDYATSRKRKTVTADDVIHAVNVLECEQVEKPVSYRERQGK